MNRFRNRQGVGRARTRGFTMVEIAIALGVIAIALVAIIGVMPTGVNVQRTNREDTIVNQDGRLWLEAIRTGARGLHYLTNYVEAIWVTNADSLARQVTIFTNSPPATRPGNPAVDGSLTNGERIVGLLSRPKYFFLPGSSPSASPQVVTNHIVAYVHSLSGPAADQNVFVRSNRMDYVYRLTSEVVPLMPFPPVLTNYSISGLSTQQWVIRSNNWLVARNHAVNAYNVCLTLQGPVIHRGPGLGYQVLGTPKTFRTTISAGQMSDRGLFFFEPATYLQVRP
jgi:prepilin-type N-terminal cleavage/methylation domain-containing protein